MFIYGSAIDEQSWQMASYDRGVAPSKSEYLRSIESLRLWEGNDVK
jgi:hypothetical protein